MRRLALAAPVLLAPVLLSGCVLIGPDGSVRLFNHQDTRTAIDQAFAVYGAHITDCAHRIVTNESGANPYAGYPDKKYKGPWQAHDGFQGSYDRAAAYLNQKAGYVAHNATPFDPYVQSWAARYAFESYGGSFAVNWAQTKPGDCP